MATWNQFSEEVTKEVQTVRAYGYGKAPTSGLNSYKAQALRLLAEKIVLEAKLKTLSAHRDAMIDLLDCVERDKLRAIVELPERDATRLINRVYEH